MKYLSILSLSLSLPPSLSAIDLAAGMKRKHSDWFQLAEQLDVEHMVKCLEAYCEVCGAKLNIFVEPRSPF